MTIKVEVDFVGVLKGLAGKRVSLEFSETVTVKSVLRRLLDCYAPALEKILIDPELEDPRPNVIILVNKQEISVLKGLETRVGNGDKLVFIPVSHGG